MGSGKSTVSRAVGKRSGWPVINIDDIGDVLETRPHRPTQIIRDWQGFLEYRAKVLPDFDYVMDCPVLRVDTAQPLNEIVRETLHWLQQT
jgi:gluconate kinase